MKKTYLIIFVLIGLVLNFKGQPVYAEKSYSLFFRSVMNPKAGINQQLIAQRVGCPPEPKNSYIRDWWREIAYYQSRNAMITARNFYFTANTNNNFIFQLKNEEDQKTAAFIFYKVASIMDRLYDSGRLLYESPDNLSKPANAKATNMRIIREDARTAWGLFIETYESIPPKERSYVCPITNSDKLIYAKKRLQELSR